ncbi:unnamed protein product [Acanthosepion pharaonis]|uniref:Uncharacterized protein n=1 Tax=Acanthosepion pharaonis TaxID=158019 RepID=A0A812CMV2_ACAPH|nr:unnamed protein product [Sepia pharaonis]
MSHCFLSFLFFFGFSHSYFYLFFFLGYFPSYFFLQMLSLSILLLLRCSVFSLQLKYTPFHFFFLSSEALKFLPSFIAFLSLLRNMSSPFAATQFPRLLSFTSFPIGSQPPESFVDHTKPIFFLTSQIFSFFPLFLFIFLSFRFVCVAFPVDHFILDQIPAQPLAQ